LRDVASGRPRTARVVSTYHDTPDRRLQRAGVAVRVRREGRRWLMTVKGAAAAGAASGVVVRPEFEWPLGSPAIDRMRLATTPWHALFAKALRKGGLAPVFVTAVARTSWPLAFPDGTTATLVLDRGTITAGSRSAAIAEIELELRDGEPLRLAELADALASDLPLAVEPRSKAERGYALADNTRDEPTRAREIVHAADATAAEAIAAILVECVHQIERNAIGLQAGAARDPEWVHQLRIGVRRLRSCLALAEGILADDMLETLRRDTRWALDALGPARDLDVFARETLPAALADLARAGNDAAASVAALRGLARRVSSRRRAALAAANACVTSGRFTRFVLAASRAAMSIRTLPEARAGRIGDGAANRYAASVIDRRARRLAKAGARLSQAGADERHAIRIAAKKLRYATEFFATLYPGKRTREYRRALAGLQDDLGIWNDAAVAPRVTSAIAGPTAPVTVAIESWSAGRTSAGARRLDDAWARFAAARPFWKS
jgi:inorganic triphosphatase YgiF